MHFLTTRSRALLAAPIPPLQFRIGSFDVDLCCPRQDIRDDFASLYALCWTSRASAGDIIRMEVIPGKWSPRGGRWHAIQGDGKLLGQVRGKREILPYLEWGINWRVLARKERFFHLHAASMARRGVGLILPGSSGSGKSTLAAALLSDGWQYFSDEFALVDRLDGRLHAFPKALCIKAGSFEPLSRLGIPLWNNRYYIKALKGRVGYIRPHDLSSTPIARPAPVEMIVFPQYSPSGPTRLSALSAAQTAFFLLSHLMERPLVGPEAAPLLADLARRARGFRLEYHDLSEALGILDETAEITQSIRQRDTAMAPRIRQ